MIGKASSDIAPLIDPLTPVPVCLHSPQAFWLPLSVAFCVETYGASLDIGCTQGNFIGGEQLCWQQAICSAVSNLSWQQAIEWWRASSGAVGDSMVVSNSGGSEQLAAALIYTQLDLQTSCPRHKNHTPPAAPPLLPPHAPGLIYTLNLLVSFQIGAVLENDYEDYVVDKDGWLLAKCYVRQVWGRWRV